jgi:hypothetical protein
VGADIAREGLVLGERVLWDVDAAPPGLVVGAGWGPDARRVDERHREQRRDEHQRRPSREATEGCGHDEQQSGAGRAGDQRHAHEVRIAVVVDLVELRGDCRDRGERCHDEPGADAPPDPASDELDDRERRRPDHRRKRRPETR